MMGPSVLIAMRSWAVATTPRRARRLEVAGVLGSATVWIIGGIWAGEQDPASQRAILGVLIALPCWVAAALTMLVGRRSE